MATTDPTDALKVAPAVSAQKNPKAAKAPKVAPAVSVNNKPETAEVIGADANKAPSGEITKSKDGQYTMNRNVKFNGVIYKKGDKVLATERCAELFLKSGYMS